MVIPYCYSPRTKFLTFSKNANAHKCQKQSGAKPESTSGLRHGGWSGGCSPRALPFPYLLAHLVWLEEKRLGMRQEKSSFLLAIASDSKKVHEKQSFRPRRQETATKPLRPQGQSQSDIAILTAMAVGVKNKQTRLCVKLMKSLTDK